MLGVSSKYPIVEDAFLVVSLAVHHNVTDHSLRPCFDILGFAFISFRVMIIMISFDIIAMYAAGPLFCVTSANDFSVA